jgi:hypothetical protein
VSRRLGRLARRLDAWADESRVNPWRLHVMRHPELTPSVRAAFDALLGATALGDEVRYELPHPKWWFLHHLTRSGFVLHGSNEGAIEEFRTRSGFDAYGHSIDAVFGTDDAIWPLYFAVVNRPVANSYINWCLHVRGESRYLFSIGSDPARRESWTSGTVYALPRDTFGPTPGSRELVSTVPVRPRARLPVSPDDFPFRAQTLGHGPRATPRTVAIRNAVRPRSGLSAKRTSGGGSGGPRSGLSAKRTSGGGSGGPRSGLSAKRTRGGGLGEPGGFPVR